MTTTTAPASTEAKVCHDIAAHQVPFTEVTPQKWQRAMGCLSGGDKNVTKARAQQLWPTLKLTHANSDAYLLAEYARKFFK